MTYRTGLAITAAILLSTPGFAQRPAHILLSEPARNVEATYTFEARYPKLTANEWEIVVARPPDLSGQSVTRFTVTPRGEELLEESDLKQPIVRTLLASETDDQRQMLRVVVSTQATMRSRRLIRFPAGSKLPAVPVLNDHDRGAALASTSRIDHAGDSFQKWLDANALRRRKRDSDVDFARRAFLTMTKLLEYQRPFDHDGKASSTVETGRGDCGCLSTVFVGVMRASGVPARELVGRLLKSEKSFETSEYGVHARAEFFAERIGWIPVDPSFALGDASPLNHFGNDPGDLLTLHLDGDLVHQTKSFGKATLVRLQGVALWASGHGNFEDAEVREDWVIRDLPLIPKRKNPPRQ